MDVDQEGVAPQEQEDDHGTEQENLEYGDQWQYDSVPTEGLGPGPGFYCQRKELEFPDLKSQVDRPQEPGTQGLHAHR
jgi:hypothetical protein